MRTFLRYLFVFSVSLAPLLLSPSQSRAARTIDSITLAGGAPLSVAGSATVSATVTVTTTGGGNNNNWRSTAWRISSSPPGATNCVNHGNHNSSGIYSEIINMIAPATAGTYTLYAIAYRDNNCSQGISSTFSLTDAVVVVDGGSGSVCTTTTLPGDFDFKAISGSSDTNIIAVGDDGTAYQYKGTSWEVMTTPTSEDIEGIHMLSDGTAYAIDDNGKVLYFNGSSWSTVYNNSGVEFKDVWAYAVNEVYAVGKDGDLIYYNGSSWSNIRSAAGASTSRDLEAVWGNSTHVYVVAEDGRIHIRTRSTGSWATITSCIGGGTDVDDAWADSSGNVYLADKDNNRILRYDGSSCSNVTGASDEPQGINGSSSTGEIYAVGKDGIILYYDGSSWEESINPGGEDLEAIWVSSTGTPYYAGDNGTITTCTPVVSTGPDHYRIEHTGSGITCQRSDVTIRACADTTCSSEYTDPVTMTLSPSGKWIGGDSVSFSGGSATFQLRQTTPATLILGVGSPNPSADNSTVCSSGSCAIEFFDSGFIFTSSGIPDLTACQPSSSVSIQAVRSDATAETCIADGGFAGSTKSVGFWSRYVNPGSGSESLAVDGTNVGSSSPGTNISLSFNSSASASYTLRYPDAGQMQLNMRYEGSGEDAGLVMLGNDSFAVRPVGLCIYSDDANADCAAGDGNCSVFKKVDEAFNLKVKGVCWESGADTDLCSGNATTKNFALSSLPITHSLIAPAGVVGTIGVSNIDITPADYGEHVISNQTVSEVGVFTFTVSPPNYLGGALPVATSPNIGRFTPDHFSSSITANGSLQDACTGFSYSGQNFSYDPFDRPVMKITAVNSSGATTQNYRADFVKLTDPVLQITMPGVTADASNLGADLATPLVLSWSTANRTLLNNNDGTLSLTLTDTFSYSRDSNALVAPVTSDIRLAVTSIVDADGIAASDLPRQFAPSGTQIRYGRLAMQNAYGSELIDLQVPMRTEYFGGSGYTLNLDDTCTSGVTLNPLIDVDVADSLLPTDTCVYDTGAPGVGGLSCGTAGPAGQLFTAPPDAGDFHLWFQSPGVGKEGSLDLTATVPTWLQFDWSATQVNPGARLTFGIYKGNPHLIYMRESVQ